MSERDEQLREQVQSQPVGARMTVGFMVAGMFFLGLVVLVAGGIGLYKLGLPMVAIAVIAIVLLGAVFSLLRRWSES